MRSFPLLIVPFVAACVIGPRAETTYTNTNPAPRPLRARAAESVEVYTSAAPPRPYTEVGVIRAHGRGHDALEQAVQGMRAKAAAVGCDGVVVTSTSSNEQHAIYTGACFLYADVTSHAPPPPSGPPGAHTCEAQLAELRAAPNEGKPELVRRLPPECVAPRAVTSPGS
jgi:hypothetical protein